MATSGNSVYTLNENQIVLGALRKVGAIASGEQPDNQLVTDASQQLNTWMKQLSVEGIHVWTETEAILFLQPNQIQYVLGPASTDNATLLNYTATTLSANVSSGTSISVASIAGIASGGTIGITLNTGVLFWTTVNGAPSGTTVTLTSAITGAAASGNAVYVYASKIVRPLRIMGCRRRNLISGLDTTMGPMMSRLDYQNLPNKTTPGVINQVFYDPQLGNGLLNVWPAPMDSSNAIRFTWQRPIQNFDALANTPDLPDEWINTLTWGLAELIGPEFDITTQRMAMIQQQAAKSMDIMTTWDREPESIYLGVNYDQR